MKAADPDEVLDLIHRWGTRVTARALAGCLAGRKRADGRRLHGVLRRLVADGAVLRLGKGPATYCPARW
jgi:hypothetical protein